MHCDRCVAACFLVCTFLKLPYPFVYLNNLFFLAHLFPFINMDYLAYSHESYAGCYLTDDFTQTNCAYYEMQYFCGKVFLTSCWTVIHNQSLQNTMNALSLPPVLE